MPRGAARPLRALTHCNAGWLATVDWGTALAPIYKAHAAGLHVHVWVDETRPRSQGAFLTAWELGAAGVPHTLIADTAAAHVLQRGLADVVLVGSDRTTAAGDVCNKIGTYAIALAARESGRPVLRRACPTSSIDWTIDGRSGRDPDRGAHADEVLECAALARPAIACASLPDDTRVQPRVRRHAREARHRHRDRARRVPRHAPGPGAPARAESARRSAAAAAARQRRGRPWRMSARCARTSWRSAARCARAGSRPAVRATSARASRADFSSRRRASRTRA